MKTLTYTLLAAGVLCSASLALAAQDTRPERDSTTSEQMRQRPDSNTESRYPNTDIKRDPADMNRLDSPENGSAMDMNDTTNDVNDSSLEMPRLKR